MPLWDSAALQVNALPRASVIDGTADTFAYYDLSANNLLRHTINEIRGLEHYSFLYSQGYSGTITIGATLGFFTRRLYWPHPMKLRNVVATVYAVTTQGVGTAADVLSSGRSIFTNTLTVSTTSLVVSANNFWSSSAPHASHTIIPEGALVDFYAANGVTTSVRGLRVHFIGWRL